MSQFNRTSLLRLFSSHAFHSSVLPSFCRSQSISGSGQLILDRGAVVLGSASLTAATIIGPSVGFSITFDVGTSAQLLQNSFSWAGTVFVIGTTGSIQFNSVTMSAATSLLTTARPPMTVAGVMRGMINSTAATTLTLTGSVATTNLIVTGSSVTTLAGASSLNVLTGAMLVVSPGITVQGGAVLNGPGTVQLNGCIVQTGVAVASTFIQSPNAGVITTIEAPNTFATYTNIGGTLQLIGTGLFTITSGSLMSSAVPVTITATPGALFSGSLNLLASTLTCLGCVVPDGSSLALTSSSSNGFLAGSITALGSVSVGSVVTVQSGTALGNGGSGRVTLSGCSVTSGVVVTANTIFGPAVSITTTIAAPQNLQTLRNWSHPPSCVPGDHVADFFSACTL